MDLLKRVNLETLQQQYHIHEPGQDNISAAHAARLFCESRVSPMKHLRATKHNSSPRTGRRCRRRRRT